MDTTDVAGRPRGHATDGRHAMQGTDLAVRISSDLLGGLLVWMGIGWLVDGWLGTGRAFTIVGALVGYAGAMWLIWLRTSRTEPDGSPRPATAAETTTTTSDRPTPGGGAP